VLRKGKTGLLRPVLRTNGTLYGAYLEFSDSFSRKPGEQSRLHTPGTILVCGRLWAYRGISRVEAHTPCNALG
jgi:hypothetical protein